MKVPASLLARFATPHRDVDVEQVLEALQEPPPATVLVVGDNDELLASLLREMGYTVVGVDLRPYGAAHYGVPLTYVYLREDICDLTASGRALMFAITDQRWFDIAISTSAIEHFGLGTYLEGPRHPYYDLIAMHAIRGLVRPGGVCYVTVPVGNRYLETWPHYRTYDQDALQERIAQDWDVQEARYFASGDIGDIHQTGETLTAKQAFACPPDPPHATALLRMAKPSWRRRARDGGS